MSGPNREPSRIRPLGRIRLILLTAISALLLFCLAPSWFSLGAVGGPASSQSQKQEHSQPHNQSPLTVNTQPWQTAQSLAASVATPKEAQYAEQAEQLADHEVDQAFAVAFRQADLQTIHQPLHSQGDIALRVSQLQQDVAQDQRAVDLLKAQSNHPSASPSDDLQVAQARLFLDSDELDDAQRDLDLANGNFARSVKDQLATHEASMRQYNNDQKAGIPLPLHRVENPFTLVGRLRILSGQQKRLEGIQKAHNEVTAEADKLKKDLSSTNPDKSPQLKAGNATSQPAALTLSRVQGHHDKSEINFINQDRIHTEQQLASVYGKWAALVQKEHNFFLRRVLQSVAAILAVLLWMILGEAILHRLTDHPKFARRQMQTLRAILRVSIQIVGILAILLFIFGPPHEAGTIIGLITAALALALQDYILAFFGWFMLSGSNGIHIGDMVEIDGVCGEVVDIGLMRTTLLETTGLREKGEPTGRRVSLLNSFAVHGTCFNFSTEGQWLWDEITITVPAGADIYSIAKSVEQVAIKETADTARLAEQDWNQKMPSTSLNRVSAAPIVMMRPSISLDVSTSIDIQVRYVTHAVGRSEVRDRLYNHVIQRLKDQDQPTTPRQTSPALS